LGQLYFVGEGVEINRDKAFQYFERAAQNGHLFAQRNIAYEMIKGRRGIARIPVGVLLAIRGLLQVIKVTVKDPDSDTIRRL
jgi:TPR repeat protein